MMRYTSRLSWFLLVLPLLANRAAALEWADLWLRSDQRAHRALQAEEYERAAQLADDPIQRGIAEYRRGDYAAAADHFSRGDGPLAAYNEGNALAQSGRLQEAIAAYERALTLDPDHEDARHNREQLTQQLQQQAPSQRSDPQSGEPSQPSSPNASPQEQQGGSDAEPPSSQAAAGEQDQGEQDQGEEEAEEGSSGQSQPPTDAGDADPTPNGGDEQRVDDQRGAGQEHSGATELAADQAQEQQEEGAQEQLAAAPLTPQERERQQALEQWLRRIPDDPGELLRRKFLYQYQQRRNHSRTERDW